LLRIDVDHRLIDTGAIAVGQLVEHAPDLGGPVGTTDGAQRGTR